jgi:hypothetical protein
MKVINSITTLLKKKTLEVLFEHMNCPSKYHLFYIPVAPSGAQGIRETLRFTSFS